MNPIRIAVVGLGKIAREQHLPSIRASDAFELVAVASPHDRLDGFPSYDSLDSLLQAHQDVQAVALCMPPQARAAIARVALRRGCHVLLEKPPGTSIAEVEELSRLADERRLTLFASWHSRYGPAVEPARTWLQRKRILRVSITWKEDVRVWHPGQDWIWTAAGFGAFDPGINALSILTRVAPGALMLGAVELQFPSNRAAPSAARLSMTLDGAPVEMDLDILHSGTPIWEIDIGTDAGRLSLGAGGAVLHIDGCPVAVTPMQEYEALYAHFAALVGARSCDVDMVPLRLVIDALSKGCRVIKAPFMDNGVRRFVSDTGSAAT
jgi:NAD-dependent oxidoreductase involved in siderophore biosynthesis